MATFEKEVPEPVGVARSSTDNGTDPEKGNKDVTAIHTITSETRNDPDNTSEEFQIGVQRVRALTKTWSKKALIVMFCLFYLVSFVDQLLVSVQGALNPFITSEFGTHGLLTSVGIISTILSGSTKLTLAKIADIFGRLEAFTFMLIVVLIGLIMKATCQSIEVYVAAHTFYWVGHIGMLYVVDVVLADITSLRNRMTIFGIMGTPLIASTFAGPAIAERFYEDLNFRWAFGAFTIILLGVCLPVMVVLFMESRRAKKAGLITSRPSGRTSFETFKYYATEFDVIGILFITAAFALILMPFNIVAYAKNGWETDYIIAMIVTGVVCGVIFVVWEAKFAPVNFLPWRYLKDPTIIGSCLLYGIMFASVFAWNSYFSSYLQVVHRMSITTSNYVLNSFSLSAAIIAPFIGALISFTGDFRWTAMAGVPLMLLGTALLIPFRTPDTHIALIVLTQCLVGVGTGLFAACGQLAIMVPVSHQEVAVVIAIWGFFGSIGSSIGFAISGGIWNNVLPDQLYQRLPEESKNMSRTIFGSLVVQLSYADGTPERDAIVGAYADVQRKMVIAGAAFMPLVLASIWIWRNVNVKKLEKEKGTQTAGTVF